MSETEATRSTRQIARARTPERRTYWIAAIVVFGSIAILTTITLIASAGTSKDGDSADQNQQPGIERPHSIPQPGDGQAPEHPNDRGGWQQYLVLGLIVVALSTVGALAWRSSRQARTRMAMRDEPGIAGEPAASQGPPA